MTTKEYRESGKHLPDFLKDFHDQKDFFKAMYDVYAKDLKERFPQLGWRDAHEFSIDIFLWFCAAHGYSLQKIRAKDVQFADIATTIKEWNSKSLNMLASILNQNPLNASTQ